MSRDKRKELLQTVFEHGKIPPQALDLEEVVLGAMMLECDRLNEVISTLQPESFYKESHQLVYQAIIELNNKNESVDMLTVTEQLRNDGNIDIVGGPLFVSMLTNRVSSSANIEEHAHIILQKFIQREIIRVSSELIRDAYEDTSDPLDLVERFGQGYDSISSVAQSGAEMVHISVAVKESMLELAEREKFAKQGKVAGIPTPLKGLNRILGGWKKTDLVIVAARPGMGKTAFMLQIAKTAAISGARVAIFSLEMGRVRLSDRLILAESGIDDEKFRSGFMAAEDWQKFNDASRVLNALPIYIDDRPGLSMYQIKAKSAQMNRAGKCDLVLIDYLQLSQMKSENRNYNREQEVSESSRTAKGMAKSINLPVILLSQLSRASEKRGADARPILSDLRESGSIEQDSDIVIFPYRQNYYDKEDESEIGEIEIIVAKHRNGPTGTVKASHNKNMTRIFDTPTGEILPNIDFSEKSENPF